VAAATVLMGATATAMLLAGDPGRPGPGRRAGGGEASAGTFGCVLRLADE
jgi:hypothetical protein